MKLILKVSIKWKKLYFLSCVWSRRLFGGAGAARLLQARQHQPSSHRPGARWRAERGGLETRKANAVYRIFWSRKKLGVINYT